VISAVQQLGGVGPAVQLPGPQGEGLPYMYDSRSGRVHAGATHQMWQFAYATVNCRQRACIDRNCEFRVSGPNRRRDFD